MVLNPSDSAGVHFLPLPLTSLFSGKTETQYYINTKIQVCLIYLHMSEDDPDGLNRAGLSTSTSHKCVFVSFSENSRIRLVLVVFLVSCMCDRTGAIEWKRQIKHIKLK